MNEKTARTSQTHPLRIDEIRVGPGFIGLTICPGKRGDSVFGAPWARDIGADVAAIRRWGAALVLTLVEPGELRDLGVEDLGTEVGKAGMDWLHLPIPDLGVPADMAGWEAISGDLHARLDRGERVLIHCRGGLGRAGTIAALLLIERGEAAPEAMRRVRASRKNTIETAVQERFLAEHAALSDPKDRMRRASLFGGAMGDSLGAEIEFWSLERIRSRFRDGPRDLPPHDGRRGAITDDTQMTLFTAEGLIRSAVRGALKGIASPAGVVHHALLRWYVTQGERAPREVDAVGLVADRRLHRRRAPGNTCLGALGADVPLGQAARNDSKGCGTIMRVAPVALAGHNVERIAMQTSALTHGHPTGQAAAAAWGLMLHAVLEGADLEETARGLIGRFGSETSRAIEAALEAPRDGRPETVERLGGGWVAEEALSIALHAALAARSFEEGLRIAVLHSGDSDSTGAIAGNMLGLMFPEEAMSHPWRREIECPDLIDRLARDLGRISRGDFDAEALSARYPEW